MKKKHQVFYFQIETMIQTRKGAEAEVQQKAMLMLQMQGMTHMKSKVSNEKLKLSLLMDRLKVNLTDYRGTKDEVGAKTERDATVLLIQTNWPKLEGIANELHETTTALLEAVSKANDTELEGDPSTMIDNFRENATEAYIE